MSGHQAVRIPVGSVLLDADLNVPADATGVVAFAHGSGSGRHSPRNRRVAAELEAAGLATVLADLLTPEEEREDLRTDHGLLAASPPGRRARQLRFDIGLLGERVVALVDWLATDPLLQPLPVGLFGASTGAAAALVAAARRQSVAAVVSRGGRPDLAGSELAGVGAATLLIVGSLDGVVLGLNRQALAALQCERKIEVVAGATHLFEEPGTLEEVAQLAAGWFTGHLGETP